MQIQYTAEFVARFWARVDTSGNCWLWTGAHSKGGYGQIRLDGRVAYTHTLALLMAGGVLAPGERTLHTCDTPGCVRNDEVGTYVVNGIALPRFGHLFTGTQADNVADMQAKSRESSGESHRAIMRERAARDDRNGSRLHPERLIGRKMSPYKVRPELVRRGESHNRSILTDDVVREIRCAYAAGEATQVTLAARFGISQCNISSIVRGKIWKHLL